MSSFFGVDGYSDLGGLDYLFSGLGSLFGGGYGYYDDYGYYDYYDDYSYYDDYGLSLSVDGLGGLFGGLFDDLGYLFSDDYYGYGYYDDYYYDDYSYDDYDIVGDSDEVIQVDGLTELLSGLLNGEGDISGLSELLAGLLGGDTTLSVDGELGDLSSLSELLAGLLGGETSLSVDGTSDLLSSLGGLSGLSVLLGGLTGGTASTSGLDLSSLASLLGGLTGGTTISVDGSTASTGATDVLSVLGNLSGLGNLFSGLTGILGGIGNGELDGFELLDSLTNLYNGAGISVDGSTASTGTTDLLSGLTGLLGGNGLSSLLSGLIGGGTASTSGLDLSALSSLLGGLTGGTTSSSASASDTTNSAYNIIGLVNLISESVAMNGEQDVSSSSGVVIQISDDSWNMMRTTSVLGSILPGEDIFVNSNGTQGIVLGSDIDSIQDALKPYNDYITVSELAGGLSITIDDLDGIQKAVALAKDPSVGGGSETTTAISSTDLAKTVSDVDSPSDPQFISFDDTIGDCIHPAADLDIPVQLVLREEAFQVEVDSLREVGFWLDDASMDMGAQNWDGWDIRAIGDFQGDGVDDLLLSHAQTGIMVMLADGNLDHWDSLDQFVTDDSSAVAMRGMAVPSGSCMVGDASQWLESGCSANWIILA